MTTMLYKSPGPHKTEGISYEYIIVEDDAISEALADGWNLTFTGAAEDAQVRDAEKLQANEEELARVDKALSGLKAVHKGRGVWEVQDAEGKTVQAGLTKEAAQAAAG